MRHYRALAILAAAAAGIVAAPAQAAGMTFDCDAPSGRIASVTGQIGAVVRATGTISPVSFQPGKSPAIGGLLVNSADGLNSVGSSSRSPSPTRARSIW